MDKIIGISNIEIYEFCKLNLETGEKKFFDDYSGFEKFDGFYFKDREEFRIEEYNICIKYRTSPYIGFDVWSDQEDVDLFYQIEQSYKNDEYYKKFTK